MDVKAYYEPTRDVKHYVDCQYRTLNHITPHFHQSIEISYCVSGGLNFYIGSDMFRLEAGQITFVPSYFVHYAFPLKEDDTSSKLAVIIIPKKYYEEFAQETNNASYFFLGDKAKNKKIGELICEFTENRFEMKELLVKSYTNMILGLIEKNYEPIKLKNTNNDLMLNIIEYIDEHYEEHITLESISSHFGYSKYYFSHLFNRTFNCTLSSYVNSVRARAVSKRETGVSKTDAIIKSGFNTLSSYYRLKNEKNRN